MQEKHSFNAEVNRVLHLMIHSLYTNKDIFLRELVSNGSDACDKLRYETLSNDSLLSDDPDLKITISLDKENRTITITDNGIGMNKDEMIENLGTIARSGTEEFLKAMSNKNADLNLIGQFGVGFYSAFIIADNVTVISRKAGMDEAYKWESTGDGSYTIEDTEKSARGTKVIVHVREGEDSYLDQFKLKHIVETYSNHIGFPVFFEEEKWADGLALWMRPKSEISEEDYKQFYHSLSHMYDDPFMTLHNKAEGIVTYTNLLFIPSHTPFDLFHPERKRRVKLYVKRVFISEDEVDLIPHWMRFLHGIVDSEDLPLNISRETLQHNAVIARVRKAIVNKVLSEIKKKSESEPLEFEKFWKNFGAVLKEGLCEEISEREKILDVCHFYSTKSGDNTINLNEYLNRMKSEQEEIYYIIGDNINSLMNSPQLEGFKKKDVEVLLLTDHVDDFWVNVSGEYKGKRFKSVTKEGIDLDTNTPSDESEKAPESKSEINTLIEKLKSVYKDDVKEIRVSHKLIDSPACLVAVEGAMDFRMERFLYEQKQIKSKMAKIMEINPTHPLIIALSKMDQDEKFKNISLLLLDQARIIEGEEINDAAAFSKRLSEVMMGVL